MPHSKAVEAVAKSLADNRFLAGVSTDGKGIEKRLVISIAGENDSPKITSIKRLSTPGRRLYCGADEIPTVMRGRGMVLISTSKGVMSGKAAKEQRLGGELICEVF